LFADADQVAELHERGVLLSVHRDELYDPSEELTARHGSVERPVESPLQTRLRHALDWIREHLLHVPATMRALRAR
jgi:hypothetical protein